MCRRDNKYFNIDSLAFGAEMVLDNRMLGRGTLEDYEDDAAIQELADYLKPLALNEKNDSLKEHLVFLALGGKNSGIKEREEIYFQMNLAKRDLDSYRTIGKERLETLRDFCSSLLSAARQEEGRYNEIEDSSELYEHRDSRRFLVA